MIEQFHSNIQSGKTRAKCTKSVPKVSPHNSQQLQTDQIAIVVCLLVLRNEPTKWAGLYTEPAGTAQEDKGLSVLSPACLPGRVLRRLGL